MQRTIDLIDEIAIGIQFRDTRHLKNLQNDMKRVCAPKDELSAFSILIDSILDILEGD